MNKQAGVLCFCLMVPERRWTFTAAFTLVELLTVIAIISILSAFLSTGLKGARESAKSLQCMSNLHQLSVGLQAYLNDYNGFFPNGYYGTDYGFDVTGGWADALFKYVGNKPYNKVFQCPSGPHEAGAWDTYRDYAQNGLGFYLISGQWRNISSIANPSATAYLMDGWANTVSPDFAPSGQYWELRHKNGLNALYADGHVQWRQDVPSSRYDPFWDAQ